MAKNKTTGMGSDAFFQTAEPAANRTPAKENLASTQRQPKAERIERRSFNFKASTIRLLDEIHIQTIRNGDKQTLSSIVERGIALVAQEMGVSEQTDRT